MTEEENALFTAFKLGVKLEVRGKTSTSWFVNYETLYIDPTSTSRESFEAWLQNYEFRIARS